MARIVPFRERLEREEFPITYEAISPRGADADEHVKRFRDLPSRSLLSGVNLTNNPSARVRIDPAAFGHLLLDLDGPDEPADADAARPRPRSGSGPDVLCHVTCRDDTLSGIQRWLFGAWALGIRNVVVMTGDHPKEGDYPEERRVDSLNAIELIAGIRQHLSHGTLIPDVLSPAASRYANRFLPPKPPKAVAPVDFFVGSPLIPWRNNEDMYAKAKLEAGSQFFQSQITWDEKPVLDWLEKMEQAGQIGARGKWNVPILVGSAPLKSERTMEFMHNSIPFVKVPDPVRARLKASGDDIGKESVQVALEMYARLKDGHRARGLTTKIGAHVLPINDDALGNAIVEGVAKL